MRYCHHFALFLIVLGVGCGSGPHPADVEPSSSLPTYSQFRAQQRSSAFTAAPERQATLLTAMASVRVGMPLHQVAAVLGRPDFASDLASKESPRLTGTEWVYLLSSENLDAVNERTDRAVVIYFGADYRVTWASVGFMDEKPWA